MSDKARERQFSWFTEISASVVVFLVALPLCMGIAIASGVPIEKGLLSGIIGGLVIGPLAGCPLQVSGPAAGLAVMCWDLVQSHGLEGLGPVVLIAGLIQVVAGKLHLGQWFRAVSPAVISGMLAGIGALIFCGQFHVMVDDAPRGSGLENLLSIPEAVYKGLSPMDGSAHHLAAAVGIATILTMTLLNRWRPGPLRSVPPPLAGVVVGAGLAAYLSLDIQYVSFAGDLLAAVDLPDGDFVRLLRGDEILLLGTAFAFVASAETLLCATAVDQLHDGERTRYDKELVAQGIGNTLCGLVGALPVTGVIVRSTANITAGGRTRASAVFHGVWIMAAVVAFPWLLEFIPRASLAAVLVYTGYKLMNPEKVRELSRYGRSEVMIYGATVAVIVCGDLLKGVLLGIGLSFAKLLYTFSRLEIDEEDNGEVIRLRLHGTATFVRLPALAAALERIGAGREVHLQIDDLEYIDHACLDLLRNWESQHTRTGGSLQVEWRALDRKYLDRNRKLDPPGSRGNQNLIPAEGDSRSGRGDRRKRTTGV